MKFQKEKHHRTRQGTIRGEYKKYTPHRVTLQGFQIKKHKHKKKIEVKKKCHNTGTLRKGEHTWLPLLEQDCSKLITNGYNQYDHYLDVVLRNLGDMGSSESSNIFQRRICSTQ